MIHVNQERYASAGPPTHVVRLRILGLAGIKVDRKHARNPGRRKEYPRPPDRMRAVIAVSRGQQIKATTPLSCPLAIPQTPAKGGSTGRNGRHVALWRSTKESKLGTLIEFEATLDRLDIGDCRHSSSQYIPKGFELLAALAEDTDHERKVALPIGIANLPISGNGGGEVVALDLPILSLKQAKPVGDDHNGLRGFQMMSIQDKECLPSVSIKKKKSFGRLLGRTGPENHQKIPSIADRRLFSSVYSTDVGDAMLRVELQVIEKDLPTKGPTHSPRQRSIKKEASSPGREVVLKETRQRSIKKEARSPGREVVLKEIRQCSIKKEASSPGREVVLKETRQCSIKKEASSPGREVVLKETLSVATTATAAVSDDSRSAEVGEKPQSSPKSSEETACTESIATTSLGSEGSFEIFEHADSIKESFTAVSDVEEPSHTTPLEADYMADDDGTVEQTPSAPRKEPPKFNKQTRKQEPLRRKYFEDFRLPTCGPVSYPDDFTIVTGDFFGTEFRFPICTNLKNHLQGDDASFVFDTDGTVMTFSDNGTLPTNPSLIRDFLKSERTKDIQDRVGKVLDRAERALGRNGATEKDTQVQVAPASSSTLVEVLEEDETEREPKEKVGRDEGKTTTKRNPLPSAQLATTPKCDQSRDSSTTSPRDKSGEQFKLPGNHRRKKKDEDDEIEERKTPCAAIFSCNTGSNVANEEIRRKFKSSSKIKVPKSLEIPDVQNNDDLTAITAQEFKFEEEKSPPKPAISSGFLFPLAFTGSGLCANIHLVDDDDSMRGLSLTKSKSNSVSQLNETVNENYFSDYDHYSIDRPRSRLSTQN